MEVPTSNSSDRTNGEPFLARPDAAVPKEVCDHCEGEGHTEDCGGEDQPCPVCNGSGEAPPTDTVQPIAWRYRLVGAIEWWYISTVPRLGKHPDDEWEVQPLYAHPEDALQYSSDPSDSDHVYIDGVLQAHPEDAPQTERMDLHVELDKRFPLFKDFQEFVSRPTRHTNHAIPCPMCGNYWASEEIPEDAPEGQSRELERAGILYISALKSLVDGYRIYQGWERIEAIRDSVDVQEERWNKALNRPKGDER